MRVNSASSSKCDLAAFLLAPIGLFPLKPLFAESFPSDGCSYRMQIDAARATGCKTHRGFESSWITSLEYCPKAPSGRVRSLPGLSGALILSTKTGGEYIYTHVPQELFESFKLAPSKGKFFDKFLRNDPKFKAACEK